MTVCLSLFIPIDQLTVLSSAAIAGGLYFFFFGLHLLARKRLLLATPTSKIRSAALGPVEVNGVAAGPCTMPAPITGKPCFLYRTTAWQQREGKKEEWEKVADETLHLPFFIDDSTGQLLVEPLGADLDLLRDFREGYGSSFPSNVFSKDDEVPPRVGVFLSRHGIVPARRLRIEERLVKPEDALFIAGTLTENPGVQVRPFSPHSAVLTGQPRASDSCSDRPRNSASNSFSKPLPIPQIIRLQSGAAPSSSQKMSQQAKIAAALTRAGIANPAAWSTAGVPCLTIAIEENAPPAAVSLYNSDDDEDGRHEDRRHETRAHEIRLQRDALNSSRFNLTPPVVLMKGASHPTFVISFRSRKEVASALAWKSAGMVWGGAAITLLGLCVLLAQMELR